MPASATFSDQSTSDSMFQWTFEDSSCDKHFIVHSTKTAYLHYIGHDLFIVSLPIKGDR